MSQAWVQEGKHVGLPHGHVEIDEIVPFAGRPPGGRIDFQSVQSPGPCISAARSFPEAVEYIIRRVQEQDGGELRTAPEAGAPRLR
jgi:hypothetical protein